MWVARPGPRVLRHDVHCAVSRGSAGAASRGGPESPALSHENIADSQENMTRCRIFSQTYPWGPGNTLIRHLEWLPGPGPPAVGWGWTSRLRYRGVPPPLRPSGAHTAHGLTGPLDPCPPNFAGAPALPGDSWVRGNYSSLPSLSRCLGAARVEGPHLYLPFFQRPPFRSSPRLGARCIAGFLPYLPCSFRLLSTSFPTVGRMFRHPLPRGLSKICATDPSFAAKPPMRGPTAVSGQVARSRGRRGPA